MQHSHKTTKTIEGEIKLEGKDLIRLLIDSGTLSFEVSDDKVNSKAVFKVPTGGDYSGITLAIDKENPIVIKYSYSYDD